MLCHTDPEHVARLSNKLTRNTSAEVFIHVDLKMDITPFKELLDGNPQVHLIDSRVNIYWAGWNSVLATIRLMEAAVKSNADRYVILQGLDYPILSNKEIENFFVQNRETEYIKAVNCTHSKIIPNYKLCYCLWYMDKGGLFTSLMARLTKYPNTHGWKYRKGYYQDRQKKYEIYRGWAHWSLTKDCVLYLLDFYRNNPKFNRYFKHCFAQDECYFHTIIYNSPFREKTLLGKPNEDTYDMPALLNLTYYEYPEFAVTVFKDKKDYSRLKDTGLLFFRKVTTKDSQELLNYIDEQTS